MNYVENAQNVTYKFNSYQDNTLFIDNNAYNKTMLLTPLHYRTMDTELFDNLNIETLTNLLEEFPNTEQLYIGSGEDFRKLPTDIVAYLHSREIAVESVASNLLPAIHLIMMEEERNYLMLVYL